jgi:hypothetical protein
MEEDKLITIRKIESEFEVLILAGMMLHTPFLKKIHKVAIPKNFTNRYIGAIVEGILDFFNTTGKAPGREIRTVFLKDFNKHVKSAEDQQVFNNVKLVINNVFTKYENQPFNDEYVFRTGSEYLIEQDRKRTDEEAIRALDRGDRAKAAELLAESKNRIRENTCNFIGITDRERITKSCTAITSTDMDFSGVIGDYLSPLRKPYFIAMLGPTKRGKSNWLLEWVIQGSCNGLNVAYFPLEMTASTMQSYMIQRLTGRVITSTPKLIDHWIPVWDCMRNQMGNCAITQQCEGSNRCIWNTISRSPQEFSPKSKHRPCSFCQHHEKENLRRLYAPTTWFEVVRKKSFVDPRDTDEYLDICSSMLRGEIKMQEHLVGTATWGNIYDALDFEEKTNGWVPDMIVIDSLDSMVKDRKLGDYRHQIGNIWEYAAQLAVQRNVILVSATQGNRFSFVKDRLEITDVAEDWSKAMVATAVCAINSRGTTNAHPTQTDQYWQRHQIEWLIHRFKKLNLGTQCITLNNIGFNSVALDSATAYYHDIIPGKKIFQQMLKGEF